MCLNHTITDNLAALFAFDLYDRDSSGVIDSTEVDMMLRDIYGKRFKKNKHAQRYTFPLSCIGFIS